MLVLVLRPKGAALAQAPIDPRLATLPDVDACPPLRPRWPSSRARSNQSRATAAAISASDVCLHWPDAAGVVQGAGFDDDDTAADDNDNDNEPRWTSR
jgi:hypothetical protein